ncbi:MAG: glycosyltransferase family 2 protein [bacterium]
MTDSIDPPPQISVIIPTRNRAQSVRRSLESLCRQDFLAAHFEVIVVANACTDDTSDAVRRFAAPFALRLHEIADAGISLARNSGAALARGRLLVFLDDDIEPLPSALAAHAGAHAERQNLVAVGPLLTPPLRVVPGFFIERLRALDAAYASYLGTRDVGLDWHCMTGGNMSTSTALFQCLGGFDAGIVSYGGEDYEFGCRAQKAGAEFRLLAEAGGYHHRDENSSFAEYLQRGRSAGRNDVDVVRRPPEVLDRVPLGLLTRPQRLSGRLGRTLAFDYPRLGDELAQALRGVCVRLEWLRLRRIRNRLVDRLYQHWYYRVVAGRVGDGAARVAFVASVRQRIGASVT